MKIISGGQTGADRAALDFAVAAGIEHGGFVPKGRWAEDGPLPDRYNLVETVSEDVNERTERNVRSADLTLILSHGPLTGGSLHTLECARLAGRPCMVVDLGGTDIDAAAAMVAAWLAEHRPASLNVAGPRTSDDPQIYGATLQLLARVQARGGFAG